MRRGSRTLLSRFAGVAAAGCLAASFSAMGQPLVQPACAADTHHAGLVVRTSAAADSHRSWCIQFSQDSISGIEALRLSGLPIVTKTYGSQGEYVCKIGDVGTDASDCPARDGSYWGYWRMTSQGWRHSGIGASGTRVRCGSLEGWAWLQGGSGPAPSAAEFSYLCKSAACKASPSAVEPAPAPSPRREPQTAAGSAPYAAPEPDQGLENRPQQDPPQRRAVEAGPAAAPPIDASVRSDPGSGEAPQQPAETGIPVESPPAPPAGEGMEPADPGGAARIGLRPVRRSTSPAVYVALGVLIAALSFLRGYLFWRSRRGP